MNCPFCSSGDSKVVDSRAAEEGTAVRRRRECVSCGRRFTTYERIEEAPLVVVKKDGRREVFSRAKLLAGLMKASEKRPIAFSVLEDIVTGIEKQLRNRMEYEVSSQEIGQYVMDRLREVDEVAYVRFASVYRQFKDVGSFLTELEKLLADRRRNEGE